MDSSLGRRRSRVILTTIVVILSILVSLVVLLPFLMRITFFIRPVSGPYNFPESVWVCNDPEICLEVAEDSVVEHSSAYVVSNGEQIPVCVYAQPDRPWVVIRSIGDIDLIRGELQQCDKDSFSFTIVEDKLFFGKYQTITLFRQQ